MSTEPVDTKFEADAAELETVAVEEQVQQAYIDYAMSVIASRALPDARDGLKPVQRRILYKMHELGVTSGSSHRKSSSIIGETMGDLHPHGDKAIYDALVRMSQDFSMGCPLVDGQGNFGSMDGDPPAAMRYTEARMSPLSEEMLDDLEKDTVEFTSNYDNRLEEPDVLPAAFPNLLVNGASGIAVGMTTDIQPHNLGEVIDATIHRIHNPDCDVHNPETEEKDLMDIIPGPDFPTGATIVGRDGIKDAYENGKGKIRVRANYYINEDENRIIITEIPFQKKKSTLVENIANYANEQTIEGISDVRDESDREGVRIVIDVKSTANLDIVENQLIQKALEETISMNHIALVDEQPERLSLPAMLDNYIEHRREVVRRRSEYELQEAEERHHIVLGRLKALDDIDNVVETIRNSDDRTGAIEALQDEFGFSESQADHITRMQLSSITGLKREELRDERDELETTIEKLTHILENEDALDEKLIGELEEVKENHNHERRTTIEDDYASVDDEDLIPQEDIVVVLTENNYIKRMNVDEFDIQNRNGKGVYAMYTDSDNIRHVEVVNTHDNLLLFTNEGDVHQLKGYEIPASSRQAHGTSVVNIVDVEPDEQIQAILPAPEEKNGSSYVTIATQNGQVKRTEISEFSNIWAPGLRAIGLPEDDEIVDVSITSGDEDVMLATENGQVIRFAEDDVRPTGRTAYGVQGIDLEDSDSVTSMTTVQSDNETILTLTESGLGKRAAVSEYRSQSRNGKGLRAMRSPEKAGKLCEFMKAPEDGEVVVSSEEGKAIRVDLNDISEYQRTANGVQVMALDDSDRVVSADSHE